MKMLFGLATLMMVGGGCASKSDWYPPAVPVSVTPEATTSTGTTTPPKVVAPKTVPTKKTPPPPTSMRVTVSITDSAFAPQVLAIKAGDTVIWVNNGATNHTSASLGALIWDSGNIPPGSSYSRKFPATGSYNYYDGVTNHTGTVIVR